MTSWRRHVLSLLGHVGVESQSVGAGAVLLTRRGTDRTVRTVRRNTWVVSKPPKRGARRRDRPAGQRPVEVSAEGHTRGWRSQLTAANRLANEHITWILRELDINCVLDVGANTGQFGRRLRRGGYTGRIVSLEPVPEHAESLRELASRDHDWRVFELALGDLNTEMEMNTRPGQMSSLLPSSSFGEQWSGRLTLNNKQRVAVRRLDGVYDSAIAGLEEPRVYLKLDTQGYDLKAFAGAGDRIRDVLAMQSEASCVPIYDGMPTFLEQVACYLAAGFALTGIFTVARDRASPRVIEFDVVMVRPGGG
jgi:FkbM family methyltransferase